ncbi:MAG: lipid A export permease/ATP-binding protein MsbA [Gammaproteobacteria bacterium]|nr:lipid A export permease/ATP-binding protein MsbA [Gammaproteobacteria bacterium]
MKERIDPQVRVVYGRLWGYVTPHKLVGLLAVLCMAATAMVEATLVYLLAPLMDETLIAKNLEASRWIPYAFFGIFILRGLTGLGTETTMGWIGRRVISDLRREVFSKLLTLPMSFFDRQASGPLLSRMSYNVEMVAESVTSVVLIAVRDVLTVFAAFGVMLYWSPKLTLFVAILIPVVAFLVRLLGIAFRRYSGRIQDTIGEVTQVTDEVVRGNWVVKVFGGYDYERDRFEDADGRNFRQNMKLINVRALGTAVTQVVFGLGIALVIGMAALETVKGRLSAGAFISFFSAMMWMLQPVRRITNVNATLQRGVAAADSLFAIVDEDDEIDGGSFEKDRVRGDVAFEDVHFAYGADDGPVIDGVSIDVPAGSTLAIVGHSGSGKTTLVSLLARFYDYRSGTIRIDGVSISDYTLLSLRRNISLVSQDVVLFNDSIRANLTYGDEYTDEEVRAAADAAHVMDFVNDLPKGLDTGVGERGATLSGGQRQRVAIGRALLKNAPVLILDEATSALDTKSERRIQDALNNLMKNRTTLVIAHRLSTVEKADRIIVLDSGRIVESGTHGELLAANGHYAALYRMQFSDEPSTE